ncbi:ATP-binding protein [Ktedonobacter sp. SOSP1-85]|uniref:AAA family ATPase n=1 Tax=Ktedonobacter sp. SOSP1-85 TaxID=2778367 RepID=UPI00191630D4|nr:AAA family ATPase [Ktedonobacter sp. SOSP1-85]GHO72237.1 ATP-binding protein [Ktedonobacter sp. SOSP1-85]
MKNEKIEGRDVAAAQPVAHPLRQGAEMSRWEPFPVRSAFADTVEYRRFVQVCEAARRYRSISVCLGASGVGKTSAARHYAQWEYFEPLLWGNGVVVSPEFSSDVPMPRTAFYTPRATATPKNIEQDLAMLLWGLQMIAEAAGSVVQETVPRSGRVRVEGVDLLVVDEVDRCSHISLEVLRDLFDRYPIGLVLLGRTDYAKTLLNQHPVASRVGVLHEFCAASKADASVFIREQVRALGLSIEESALDVCLEKTRGNLSKIYLILTHLDSLARRDGPFTVTRDDIEEAQARLLTEKNVHALQERNR